MELLLGNCLDRLKDLEDNSVDAIVTDPPYGLSFMGKKWDYDVPSVDIWKECLRVLKPGGYLLSFAGTRTQHRMAVNIEDAGFEIRDMIAWVYGSGFPKSLNIGKAIDKIQGNEREVVERNIAYPDSDCWSTPNKNKGSESTIWQKGEGEEFGKGGVIKTTKGTSEWEGFGTALKPALEPITLARKPIEKGLSIAENCLKWGVGGINIDGCRVEIDPIADASQLRTMNRSAKEEKNGWGMNQNAGDIPQVVSHTGRFPANLIHDGSDEVVGLFPQTKSGKLKSDCYEKDRENDSMFAGGGNYTHKGYQADSGSASRFFKTCEFAEGEAQRFLYTAKASKRERNIGCEGLEKRAGGSNAKGYTQDVARGLDRNRPVANFHPTVKPIALMEYLVKLVSREGQVILDPFMGSGTTGMACKKLDREFIGIEMMPEYMEIAKRRIGGVKKEDQLNMI